MKRSRLDEVRARIMERRDEAIAKGWIRDDGTIIASSPAESEPMPPSLWSQNAKPAQESIVHLLSTRGKMKTRQITEELREFTVRTGTTYFIPWCLGQLRHEGLVLFRKGVWSAEHCKP